MAITFVSAGAVDAGTTELVVPYPAGILSGDLLLLVVEHKQGSVGTPVPITPPLEWSSVSITDASVSGGFSSISIDRGPVRTTVCYMVADGSETGSTTITVNSGNTSLGQIFLYRKDPGLFWDIDFASGSQDTGGSTTWSISGSVDPGITVGDIVLVASGSNSDAVGSFSGYDLAATGISSWSVAVERAQHVTTAGFDSGLVVTEHIPLAGTSSGLLVFTMTSDLSTVNSPSGSSVFVRLRESLTDPALGQVLELYTEVWTTSILSHIQIDEFYTEVWTEGPWEPRDPSGQVSELYTEVWTETPVVSAQVGGVYAEVWTEGPWEPNDPKGQVVGLYSEVWAETPVVSGQVVGFYSEVWTEGLSGSLIQYDGLRRALEDIITSLCLVAVADAPTGMGGVVMVRKNGVTYAAYLVEVGDPNASSVRVKTSTGVKAIRLKT